MSLSKLPNELLVEVLRKLRPLDQIMIRKLIARCEAVARRFNVERPVAKTLRLDFSSNGPGGGWLHRVDIVAEVTGEEEPRDSSAITDDQNESDETMMSVAKALNACLFGGPQELILDPVTMEFDFDKIQGAIGFDFSKLSKVTFPWNISPEEILKLPFIDDTMLMKVAKSIPENIHYANCETAITIKGVIDYVKDRMNGIRREQSHFGVIQMSVSDHSVLHNFAKKITTPGFVLEKKGNHIYILRFPRKSFEFYFITKAIRSGGKRKAV